MRSYRIVGIVNVVLVVTGAASTSYADSLYDNATAQGWHTKVELPIALGVSVASLRDTQTPTSMSTHSHVAFSVRPAVYEMYKRVGAGIFLGDTLTGSETGHFSFGPTFVLPVSHHTALIPSVGLEYRESDRKSWQRGVNAGLFFGLFDVGPTLTPFSFGPRVDLFYGTTHAKDRTVVFSIQGDTPLILVEILILIWKGLR